MVTHTHVFRELPTVDSVGIFDLSDVLANRVSDYMAAVPERPTALADGASAARIATLWRALTGAPQDRCHDPPFGLRFMRGGRQVLEASVCWACNNIFGSDEQGPIHAEFDANHEVARELFLELCEATTSWSRFVLPDGTSHPQTIVSEDADWDHFEAIAVALQTALGGTWSGKLDGLDERYWDLAARGGRVTLHLQHYLGISIHPTQLARPDVASLALLRAAHRLALPGRPQRHFQGSS